MKKIENINQGEVIDTIYVFQSQEEREAFFDEMSKKINLEQASALSAARWAYNDHKNKIYGRRIKASEREKAIGELDSEYMRKVHKIHELYAGARSKLIAASDTSLLEQDLRTTPESETF